MEWMSCKENVESSSEIHRDASGTLLKTVKKYHILNWLKGHTKYFFKDDHEESST
jgi:hypothetical protein